MGPQRQPGAGDDEGGRSDDARHSRCSATTTPRPTARASATTSTSTTSPTPTSRRSRYLAGGGGHRSRSTSAPASGSSVLEVIAPPSGSPGGRCRTRSSARRPGDPVATYADPTLQRGRSSAGGRRRTLDDIIASAWAWHHAHPDGYRDARASRRRRLAGAAGTPPSCSATARPCSCGRSARPTQPALDAFHRRQSPESNYRRFFSAKPMLTPAELRHFTDVDMVDRAALCVEWHGEFIAWASYERWPGRDDADTAFMVDDAHHGKGIATLLLEHLAAIATSNGIERFTAEVLADNRPMLAVFARAGWPLRAHVRQRRHRGRLPDRRDPRVPRLARRARAARRQPGDGAAAAPALDRRRRGVGPPRHGRFACCGATSPAPPTCRCTRSTRTARPSAASIVMAWSGPTRSGRPSPRSPTTCGWRSSPCPPPRSTATLDDCIAAHVRGAVIVTAGRRRGQPGRRRRRRWSPSARRHGVRIIGPSSMGVATSHREIGLEAALVPVELSPGSDRHLDAVGLARRLAAAARPAPRHGPVVVRVARRPLRRVGQRPAAVLGRRRLDQRHRHVQRDARQHPALRSHRPAVSRAPTDRRGPHGRRRHRPVGWRALPALRTDRGAERDGDARHRPRAGHATGAARSTRGGRVQLAQPGHARRRLALDVAGLELVAGAVALDWTRHAGGLPRRAIAAAIASDDVDGVLVIHAPPIHDAVGAPVDAIDEASAGGTKPVVAVLLGSVDGPIRPGSRVPGVLVPRAGRGGARALLRLRPMARQRGVGRAGRPPTMSTSTA